jgi:hypothetical protein
MLKLHNVLRSLERYVASSSSSHEMECDRRNVLTYNIEYGRISNFGKKEKKIYDLFL